MNDHQRLIGFFFSFTLFSFLPSVLVVRPGAMRQSAIQISIEER